MKKMIEETKELMKGKAGFIIATAIVLFAGVICAACGVAVDPSGAAAFVPFLLGPVDFAEVMKEIEERKDDEEVKGFVSAFVKKYAPPVTIDMVKPLFDSDPNFKQFKSTIADDRVQAAIKTYEEKTLPVKIKAHEEELRKVLQPKETEEQKQIREIREKLDKSERDSAMKDRRMKVLGTLTEKKLPSTFVDILVADSDEATDARMNGFVSQFEEIVGARVNAEVESRFKKEGRIPPKANEKVDDQKKKEDEMSDAEYLEYRQRKDKK